VKPADGNGRIDIVELWRARGDCPAIIVLQPGAVAPIRLIVEHAADRGAVPVGAVQAEARAVFDDRQAAVLGQPHGQRAVSGVGLLEQGGRQSLDRPAALPPRFQQGVEAQSAGPVDRGEIGLLLDQTAARLERQRFDPCHRIVDACDDLGLPGLACIGKQCQRRPPRAHVHQHIEQPDETDRVYEFRTANDPDRFGMPSDGNVPEIANRIFDRIIVGMVITQLPQKLR
jgi:hypothetical protein